MTPSQNVPASAISIAYQGSLSGTPVAAIGDQRINGGSETTPRYLFLVVSLSDLSIAANVQSESNSEVPSEVQPFVNSPEHCLIFVAISQITGNLPQGNLAVFLRGAGSGRVLEGMEQAIGQFGTGYQVGFTYALGTTLDEHGRPGFEVGSFNGDSYLTFAFMPLEGGGYTPVSL